MYAKLEKNKLTYAPRNFNTSAKLILNFNKNIELMKQYGFKEVIDNKPIYDNTTQYITISGYIENDDNITINYTINEIEIDNEPTLRDRIIELEKNNKGQDELINTALLAMDEMFMMLEPLIVETLSDNGSNRFLDMYVAIVQRGLKQLDNVPVRYKEQVNEIIEKK